jgi:SAM-dependent methyltransferase
VNADIMSRPTDPLAGSTWSAPGTVAGFLRSAPNAVLITFAERELRRGSLTCALDVGCGAGRNAIPLAQLGWHVTGIDLSWPMLVAASERARKDRVDRVGLVLGGMDVLPVRSASCGLVIAHGIWNLAPSGAVFRQAVRDAARVAVAGAALFVFTFSRNTLAPEAEPIAGEQFVFTQFSGQPQVFLTEEQLVAELGAAGFVREPSVPLSEYNRRPPADLGGGPPVIFEAVFRKDG